MYFIFLSYSNKFFIQIKEYEISQEKWEEGMKNTGDQFEFLWSEIQKNEKHHKQKCSKFNTDEGDDDFVAELVSKVRFIHLFVDI